MDRITWIILAVLLGLAAVVGVLALQGDVGESNEAEATQVTAQRSVSVSELSADERDLIAANTQFAFDLYRALREEDRNLILSSYSVSLAMAMVFAGADGETQAQLVDALHFEADQWELLAVFGDLHRRLGDQRTGAFRLTSAASLWWQDGFELRQDFLDTAAKELGATLSPIDFSLSESAVGSINAWASQETGGGITNLISPETISPLTRLLVTGVIAFRAQWRTPFNETYTHATSFERPDGTHVTVPMMDQIDRFSYTADEAVQAIELPYEDERFSMLILLPSDGRFEEFTGSLTADRVGGIVADLTEQLVQIYMPRFEFQTSIELADALRQLGVTDAFVLGQADLRGMTLDPEFFLDDVIHQAMVSVDEHGTYAAAATAAEMIGPDVPTVRLDRPFLFLIRDAETETILFFGQVTDPSAE